MGIYFSLQKEEGQGMNRVSNLVTPCKSYTLVQMGNGACESQFYVLTCLGPGA